MRRPAPLKTSRLIIITDFARTTEPRRSMEAAGAALKAWTPRQFIAAGGFSVLFALLIGIPTVMIPNPVFGREIDVLWWNYPVWISSSILAGMLAATYIRPSADPLQNTSGSDTAQEDDGSRQGKLGIVGTALTWFAVGCPVCNKLALLALGYSGAITWFAPIQPFLAVGALLLTGGALLFRLRGQTFCTTRGRVPARLER